MMFQSSSYSLYGQKQAIWKFPLEGLGNCVDMVSIFLTFYE